MRIPLTKYGWPQVVVLPAAVLAAMLICPHACLRKQTWGLLLPLPAVITIETILAVVLIWSLAFFRDPHRVVPADKNLLLAPADGRITDIETVPPSLVTRDSGHGATLRIGIFLSIFDVHINRAPCNVKVKQITYKPGKYKNAANPKSGRANESNSLELVRTDSPQDRLIVRQISGAIARRIICRALPGQELTGGEKFGMIKFGSRCELYVPAREDIKLLVKTGDKVKAGLTPLIRYERCQD